VSPDNSGSGGRSPDRDWSRDPLRASRGENPGRRRTDHDPRATFTKKFFVIALAVVNAIYLVSVDFLGSSFTCGIWK